MSTISMSSRASSSRWSEYTFARGYASRAAAQLASLGAAIAARLAPVVFAIAPAWHFPQAPNPIKPNCNGPLFTGRLSERGDTHVRAKILLGRIQTDATS